MKPSRSVRPLTDDERLQLEAERRVADAVCVRRAQIMLARARGWSPKPMAPRVGCGVVEPPRPAPPACLDRGQAAALAAQRARSARPRAPGRRVVWATTQQVYPFLVR
jgi:hypothetical protein